MNPRITGWAVFSWLLLSAATGRAEDIDLFKGGGAQDPSPPNVLIFLDNTSNWSANNQAWSKTSVSAKCNNDATCLNYVNQIFGNDTKLTQGQVEVAAIKLVLNELVCNASTPTRLNVGLMLLKPAKGTYANNAGTSINNSGVTGFVRRAVTSLNASRCPTLLGDLDTLFGNITSSDFKADASANYGGALFEAFKYYGGHASPSGTSTGTAGTPVGHVGYGALRFGTPIAIEETLAFTDPDTRLSYRSPITSPTANTCGGKNYVLLVGNGYPNADDTSLLSGLGYSYLAAQFPLAASGRISDVWARFLATTDVSPISGQQTVQTYVMNIYNASPDPDQTTLLKSIARNGNGTYYEIGGNLGGLIDSFRNFFISINAANQAFAPATLPMGLSAGGLDLNQVYLGMFRPDKNPRWFGNLKLYQLALYGTNDNGTPDNAGDDRPNLYLTDSSNQTPPRKVQSGTGFLADDAVSFWTQPSTFWNFRCGPSSSTGDPLLCGTPISGSDAPDGAVVEKGGAGQKLRLEFTADASNSNRKLYTDSNGSLITVTSGNVTAGQLGVSTSSERDNLVNWYRGVDNIGENPSTSNGPRPSLTGDVLHSEPVAVNYGNAGGGCSGAATGDIVVFYAGNDGLLRALNGGTTGGTELWAYIPSDFLASIKRLRDNAPAVTFPAPVPAGAFNRPYRIDGNLSVYAPDANGDCVPDKVWLFVSLRRGGRFIAALDVADRNSPRLIWKRANTDAGFSELGQTWSKLKPIMLKPAAAGGADRLALIFGAGYDPNAEDRPFDTGAGSYGNPVSGSRNMGRGVFVVTLGASGQIDSTRFFSGSNYSFPSDIAVVTDINTGYAERAYVGDTGGNLWRISFKDPTTSAITGDANLWSMVQIASLGGTGNHARKFLYPPDVARCGNQDVILIGSGNREEPFDRLIANRFYQVQDVATGIVTTSELTDVTTVGTAPNPDQKGWYINLATGEKTVGSAVTQSGTTYFPTHEAASNAGGECNTSLGTARLYGISCATGGPSVYAPDASGQATSRYEVIPGGGFPPSPTTTVVRLTDSKTGETKTVEAVLSGSHVGGGKQVATHRRFTYWYREGLD